MDKTKIVAIFVVLCRCDGLADDAGLTDRKKHRRIELMRLCLK